MLGGQLCASACTYSVGEMKVVPMGSVFGARLENVDLAALADDSGVIQEIKDALIAHKVLVVDNHAHMDPAALLRLAEQLGPV